MAYNAIVDKLRLELMEPITTERQVVYILVETRKVLELQKWPGYGSLRFLCDWAVHVSLKGRHAKNTLSYLKESLRPLFKDGSLIDEHIDRTQNILGFIAARDEFLVLIRHLRINSECRHVFGPAWWAAFLRQYLRVIQDCPMELTGKELGIDSLESASVKGLEVSDGARRGPKIESTFEIKWVFAFKDGTEYALSMPLDI